MVCNWLTDQKIERDADEPQRDDDGIDRAHGLDSRRILAVVQPQRLESRLECMVEVKAEDDDQYDVKGRIPCGAEKVDGHMVKVVVAGNHHRPFGSFGKAQLHEIEIDEVDHQEDEDHDARVDHVLAEERSV